jgi:hypothetical protein
MWTRETQFSRCSASILPSDLRLPLLLSPFSGERPAQGMNKYSKHFNVFSAAKIKNFGFSV